ncbi:lysophospholipid acyltransferase family protein [Thermodesulforhabdus norvegica]|uniref:DUF374 domain-containing protein n=1 Tax=Thermodesulforhabdus norvegica TaxID=39841 RepID=A0A1I4UQJ2_9BACT|nr:lysophospholipid acyltransferase family protein [Thermodesulforhabdus norvegica]SFM91232.1 hypothetical protein SAMN05660836_01936 [Thermodesulforhabdus norvegica]
MPTPRPIKKFFRDEKILNGGALMAEKVASLWLRSCNFTVLGKEIAEVIEDAGIPVLVTTWHCGLLPVLYFFRHRRTVVMVSSSRDGDWISSIVERWGYATVRGSSGRQGRSATRRMLQYLSLGYYGGLIADGSRGPARVAQKGVLFISSISGVPIVPVGVGIYPKLTLPTWDRMLLPLPFSRVVITIGPLINLGKVNKNRDTAELTHTLNRLFAVADRVARSAVLQ